MANPILSQLMIADFERVCLSWEYSHESVYVENTSGAAVQLKGLAYPCKAGSGAGFVEVMTAAESATAADIVGYLVTNRDEELAATSGVSMAPYALLTRGEVVVSNEGFATVDPHAGATYTAASNATFCAAANPPIVIAVNTGQKSQLDRS